MTNTEDNKTPTPPTSILAWHALGEREKFVWAAHYAGSTLPPRDAALAADKAVMTLAELNLDNRAFIGPEYDACRYYSWMEYNEFKPWYPTAFKIAKRGHFNAADISEEACQQAFERYKRSSGDFY